MENTHTQKHKQKTNPIRKINLNKIYQQQTKQTNPNKHTNKAYNVKNKFKKQ